MQFSLFRVICVLGTSLVLAGSAAAAGPFASLPAGWSHAEINVRLQRAPHTLVYDRGRVQSVTASSLTLREADGSIVTIALATTTKVTINGQIASSSQILQLDQAQTIRIDGGSATLVQVKVTPAALALAQRQAKQAAALAAKLAARQAAQKAAQAHRRGATTTTTPR